MNNTSKATSLVTPESRINWPSVFEPRAMREGDAEKYSVQLIIDKDKVEKLKQAVNNAIKDKWKDKPPANLRIPFNDGESQGRPEYKDKVYINAKAKIENKPKVVDPYLNEIMDKDEVYSGCYGRAYIRPYCYDFMGNRGVAFSLIYLMKTKDGERLDSRPSVEDAFSELNSDDNVDNKNEDYLS